MKAIIHHRYGPPGVLALEEIDKPVAGDEDVVIRVHAAGLNYADGVLMRGVPYIARLFSGLRQPRHGVQGMDVAGTVTEAGTHVADLHPGDEVFGSCDPYTGGAFAEYARIPRDKVAPKPATITFEQAAAVPLAAVTALQAPRDTAQLQPGQQALINGASGGVGTFAAQIAKALGANVTGVCSTRNTRLLQSIGADAVIDYTRDDFTQGTERFDVILDNVANHPLSHCLRAHAEGNAHTKREHPRPLDRRLQPAHRGARDGTVRAATHPHVPCEREPGRSARPHRAHRIREDHTGDRPDLPAQRGPRGHPLPRAGTRTRQDRHHHVKRDPQSHRSVDLRRQRRREDTQRPASPPQPEQLQHH